jgi:hypothetical protein
MVDQDERVRLLARYLAAWRASEQAERRFCEAQVWVFGVSAVLTVDALADLVEAGFVAWGATNPNLGKSPADPPTTDADREMVYALSNNAARAREALHVALLAVRAAMEQDGYTWSDAWTFDGLLAWAGVDMEMIERVVRGYSPMPAASGSDALATVVGSPENETHG